MSAQKTRQRLAREHLGQGPRTLLLTRLDLLEVPQPHAAGHRAVGPRNQDILDMLAGHMEHTATRQHLQHRTEGGLRLVGKTLKGRRAPVVGRRKMARILHPPKFPSVGRSTAAAA